MAFTIKDLTDEQLLEMAGQGPSSLRNDGTQKGTGFFGVQKMADGTDRDMTEFSIGVDFGQGEVEIPTLVPSLTGEELNFLRSGNAPSQAIMDKARIHAEQRIAGGRSPFIEAGEAVTNTPITDEEIISAGGQVDWPDQFYAPQPAAIVPTEVVTETATEQSAGPRNIKSLSDAELKALANPNQPGAYRGFSDALKESVADVVGFPGTVVEGAHKFVVEQLGLPEYEDAMLSGKGLKKLMTNIGLTTGLTFEERTPAGKIGSVGGSITGMALPFTAAIGLGSKGVNLTATMLAGYNPTMAQKILASAATAPKTFYATELGAIGGAAQGAMLMEASFPGNETAKLAGEILGSLVNPLGAGVRVAGKTGEAVASTAKSLTRAGREDNAAKILKDLLEETGEDVPSIIKLLEKVEDVTLTSGVKTGSEALLKVESRLLKSTPTFANKVESINKSAFADMRQTIDNMTATGDPQLLRVAAKLRGQYFDDLINERVRLAKKMAAEASARITVPGTKSGASADVYKIMKDALGELRVAESSLWEKIPRDIKVTPTRLGEIQTKLTGEILEEEAVPFAATLNRMQRDGTTSGELLTLRSRALEKSRTLRAEKKYGEARQVGMIADAAMDDLGTLGLPIVTQAREFSSSLHKNFMSTFAGDVLSTSRTGAERISPELILERAFGSGGTAGKIRMDELTAAGRFADDTLVTSVIGDAVRNEQERFLRMVADSTMENGIVNANKLRTFMTKNAELLERFPQLATELSDAGSATRLLAKTEALKGQANKAIMRKAAFAQVAEVENPTMVVSQILTGKNPIAGYRQLAKLAKRSGPGAMAGLRTSTIDHEIAQAMTPTGVSFTKLRDNLVPRLEMMRKEGVLDTTFDKNLTGLLDRAAEIETNIASKLKSGDLIDEPDQFFDMAVRIAGAKLGAASVASKATGASLIAASAGSRALRNLLEKVPASRVTDILVEAAENPAFMVQILKRVKTKEQGQRAVTQLRSSLIAAGIIAGDDADLDISSPLASTGIEALRLDMGGTVHPYGEVQEIPKGQRVGEQPVPGNPMLEELRSRQM